MLDQVSLRNWGVLIKALGSPKGAPKRRQLRAWLGLSKSEASRTFSTSRHFGTSKPLGGMGQHVIEGPEELLNGDLFVQFVAVSAVRLIPHSVQSSFFLEAGRFLGCVVA